MENLPTIPTKFVWIIAGNIGSGKTTIAKALHQQMPEAHYLCLDDFREKQMHPNRNRAENDAKVALRKELFLSDQIIYEMTQSHFHSTNLKKWKEAGYVLFCVKLKCSPLTCRKRFADKEAVIPFHLTCNPAEMIDILYGKLQKFPANIEPNTENNSPEEVVDEIINQWSKFNTNRTQHTS